MSGAVDSLTSEVLEQLWENLGVTDPSRDWLLLQLNCLVFEGDNTIGEGLAELLYDVVVLGLLAKSDSRLRL